MSIEDNLKKLNLKLPDPKDPVGSYVATKISNNLLYISGQISIDENGTLIKGKVGKELSVNEENFYKIIDHIINKNKLKYRTQDLKKSYHDSGTFGMFKSNVFYKNYKISFLGYVIPRTKGIDIDNIDDWKFAEKIFQFNLNKN